MQLTELLTTDKRFIQSIIWLGRKAYSYLPQQAGLQPIPSGSDAPVLHLPRKPPLGCLWSLGKEDLASYGDELVFISQMPSELVHCRLASDHQSLHEIAAFAVHPHSGCPQFHPQSGYLWIEECHDEAGTVSTVYHRSTDAEQAKSRQIFSRRGYFRQLRWSHDGQSFYCVSWKPEQLAWEASEIFVWTCTNDVVASIQNLPPLPGIQHLVRTSAGEFIVCAWHGDEEALYRYDPIQLKWSLIDSSGGRFYSRSPFGNWDPCLVYHPRRDSVLAVSRKNGISRLEEFFLTSGEHLCYQQLEAWTDIKHLSLEPGGELLLMEAASFEHRPQLLSFNFDHTLVQAISRLPPLGQIKLQTPLCFSWSSTSYGFYYAAEGKNRPLLVLLHGGPYQEVCATWPLKAHYFNRLGYSLVYLNFAGSSGQSYEVSSSIEGHWGQKDCTDIIQGVTHALKEFREHNGQAILWGGAAGGLAVLQVMAAAPNLVSAGIVVYPFVDLHAVYERASNVQRDYLHRLILGPGRRDEPLPQSSPSYLNAEKIHKICQPLAVFHGQKDLKVPWQCSAALVRQLNEQGVDVRPHFYPDLGHQWSDKLTLTRYYGEVEAFLSSLEKADGA